MYKFKNLLLLFSFTLTSCKDDDDVDNASFLVGTWYEDWGDGNYIRFTFNADGSGITEEMEY